MAGSPVREVVLRGDKQKIQQARQILGQARATRAEHLTKIESYRGKRHPHWESKHLKIVTH